MRFSRLMEAAGVAFERRGSDVGIARVEDDSRRCEPGVCFVAVRGCEADGHRFIPAAIRAGAAAVVCEDACSASPDVPCAIVRDSRRALGPIAQAIRGWPGRALTLVGVTGTNGKTTVTTLVRDICITAGRSCASIGTISYETGDDSWPSINTTPGAVALAGLMDEARAAGRTHLVMEVSSHALDQDRVGGLDFSAAVFTNLTGDHLDYHGTVEAYRDAKAKLFTGLSAEATAVINADDPAGAEMVAATRARTVRYGIASDADVRAEIARADASGTRFTLSHGAQCWEVRTKLIGQHNVSNCLAAAGTGLALGIDGATIAAALSAASPVPGRLQRIEAEVAFDVFVDYAHTDDALENVLRALRPLTRRRLGVVFGCGGDRDRMKRPRMAAVAGRYADRIIITSDNPRSEEPSRIIADIVAGLDVNGPPSETIEDRSEAIDRAIATAEDGDVVLLAGKGHETYQILAQERIHFDDVEVAREAIARRASR